MAVFPPSLPNPLLGTFLEVPLDNVVRFPTDSGVAQTRRRYPKSVRKHTFELLLTEAEVTIAEDFHEITLADGVLPFDWIHPRKQVVVIARYKIPSPARPASDTHFRMAFEFEIIP